MIDPQLVCVTIYLTESINVAVTLELPPFFFISTTIIFMLSNNKTSDSQSSKKSVPKIDFSLFTTADGTVVSTKERVIKGILHI